MGLMVRHGSHHEFQFTTDGFVIGNTPLFFAEKLELVESIVMFECGSLSIENGCVVQQAYGGLSYKHGGENYGIEWEIVLFSLKIMVLNRTMMAACD